MSHLQYPAQSNSQSEFADLDLLLESGFGDLSAFPWPAQSAGMPSNMDCFGQGTQNSELQSQIVTLGQDDLFANSWAPSQAPPLPGSKQSPLQTSQHSLYNNNFGQSFDLPDLTNTGTDALNNSPITPPNSALFLNGRQPSGNFLDDDADVRVTFKDKMNPPSDGNKALSLAERNKQAQRRHRQRQKDRMGMLEAQVKQLMEEKQELAAEKATLAGQNAVLSQVLRMRDDQLQQIRSGQAQTFNIAQQSSKKRLGIKEEVAENENRSDGAVSSGLADSLANVLTLTVRQDQEIRLSPAQVKAMDPQEISRMWAEYLSAMIKELEIVDTSPSDMVEPALSRIKLLLQEVLVLLMRYALGDLRKMKTFVASYIDSSEKREVWRAAARCMALRDQQKQALIRLRQIFLSKQKSLVDERLRAIQAMHEAIPNPASSHDIANQFLKTEEAIQHVQFILHKENQLIVDLVYTIFLKVVTPVQAARCLVSSFPSYPDSLTILTWVVAEAGDSEAMKVLIPDPPTDGNLSCNQSLSGGDHSA